MKLGMGMGVGRTHHFIPRRRSRRRIKKQKTTKKKKKKKMGDGILAIDILALSSNLT